MFASLDLPGVATLLAVLAPMLGLPLGIMSFYLRGLRDEQTRRAAHTDRCVQRTQAEVDRLSHGLHAIARTYTTKEEWLRESMLARRRLETLMETTARIEATVSQSNALAAQLARQLHVIAELTRTLASRAAPGDAET